MKKLAIVTVVALFMAASAQAAPVAYEGFDYTAGQSLLNQSGGSGWTAAWVNGTLDEDATIVSPGLTYSGLPTVGNASTTQNQSNARAFTTTGLMDDGDVLWFSCLLNPTGTSSDLRFQVTSTNARGKGGGFRVGSYQSETEQWTVTAAINDGGGTGSVLIDKDSVSLIVGRTTFADSGDDRVDVWVNPTSEPTGDSTVYALRAMTAGDYVWFGGGGSWQANLDEIRVGTTFSDVVVPEPATMVLLSLGGVGLILRRRRA